MNSPYFTRRDHDALASQPARDVDEVKDKFAELHRTLYRRMRDQNYDLHPHWDRSQQICARSAVSSSEIKGLSMPYLRSREQSIQVERLMGRDGADLSGDIYRHPVIELRLTPDHFVVELVMSPLAWWDQRNLIGKLSVARHRDTLRSLIQHIDGDFRFGFWDGAHLSDMHLTSRQLQRGTILDEWMGTFSDGQDWLRIGAWYEPEDGALSDEHILNEVVQRVFVLYKLYTFMLWTSNNNFQSFYRKGFAVSGKDARI